MSISPKQLAEQRDMARERANRVRQDRVAILGHAPSQHDLAFLADLVDDTPPALLSMRLDQFLKRGENLGSQRINAMCLQMHVSPMKSLGSLTERQADELSRRLRGKKRS